LSNRHPRRERLHFAFSHHLSFQNALRLLSIDRDVRDFLLAALRLHDHDPARRSVVGAVGKPGLRAVGLCSNTDRSSGRETPTSVNRVLLRCKSGGDVFEEEPALLDRLARDGGHDGFKLGIGQRALNWERRAFERHAGSKASVRVLVRFYHWRASTLSAPVMVTAPSPHVFLWRSIPA
jgi:hypothetical protein